MHTPIITEFERLFRLVSQREKLRNPQLDAKKASIQHLLFLLKEATTPRPPTPCLSKQPPQQRAESA